MAERKREDFEGGKQKLDSAVDQAQKIIDATPETAAEVAEVTSRPSRTTAATGAAVLSDPGGTADVVVDQTQAAADENRGVATGLTVAAVPEPTPVTESAGLLIAGTAAGGAYLSTKLNRDRSTEQTIEASEISTPEQPGLEQTEISTPSGSVTVIDPEVEAPDAGEEMREIPLPENYRNENVEIQTPENVDESEIKITDDNSVVIPAEAALAYAEQRAEEDEDEEDEEKDDEDSEDEPAVPEEMIPEGTIVIGTGTGAAVEEAEADNVLEEDSESEDLDGEEFGLMQRESFDEAEPENLQQDGEFFEDSQDAEVEFGEPDAPLGQDESVLETEPGSIGPAADPETERLAGTDEDVFQGETDPPVQSDVLVDDDPMESAPLEGDLGSGFAEPSTTVDPITDGLEREFAEAYLDQSPLESSMEQESAMESSFEAADTGPALMEGTAAMPMQDAMVMSQPALDAQLAMESASAETMAQQMADQFAEPTMQQNEYEYSFQQSSNSGRSRRRPRLDFPEFDASDTDDRPDTELEDTSWETGFLQPEDVFDEDTDTGWWG